MVEPIGQLVKELEIAVDVDEAVGVLPPHAGVVVHDVAVLASHQHLVVLRGDLLELLESNGDELTLVLEQRSYTRDQMDEYGTDMFFTEHKVTNTITLKADLPLGGVNHVFE